MTAYVAPVRTAAIVWHAPRLRGASWARPVAAPFAVALALRLALPLLVPVRPVWDGAIYARAADFLAHGLGYVQTVHEPALPATATAFYPIGFPALLAPLRWLQVGRALDLPAQALFGALAVIGAYLLGRRAGGLRAGRIAAWTIALWPGGILLASSWLGDGAFALFVLGASLVIAYAKRRSSERALAIAALVLGAGAYVRPTALPILLALAIGAAIARRARPHMIAVALAIALAVIAPWTVRNALSLDGPALISTNAGVNLLIGARGEGVFAEVDDVVECATIGGEVARDRCYGRHAVATIAGDPLAWLGRAGLKLVHTFGHESAPAQAWARATERAGSGSEGLSVLALAITRAWWLPFAAASALGAWIAARRKGAIAAATIGPVVGLAALHAVFLGGDRYHAAVVPVMAALAALAIVRARRFA